MKGFFSQNISRLALQKLLGTKAVLDAVMAEVEKDDISPPYPVQEQEVHSASPHATEPTVPSQLPVI